MSSSEQQSHKSTRSTSSEAQHDAQARHKSLEPTSSAGEHMSQQTDSTTNMVSSHAPTSPETLKPPSNSSSAETDTQTPVGADEIDLSHQLPIPPASEPMQYRAIGLIRGKYVPSEEQFTRGELMPEAEEAPIDAVLLGRVMSLVKKHIDLDQPHLWVVYPRTRSKDSLLHAQIVGIWEPENLNQTSPTGTESEVATDNTETDQTSDHSDSSHSSHAVHAASDSSHSSHAVHAAAETDSVAQATASDVTESQASESESGSTPADPIAGHIAKQPTEVSDTGSETEAQDDPTPSVDSKAVKDSISETDMASIPDESGPSNEPDESPKTALKPLAPPVRPVHTPSTTSHQKSEPAPLPKSLSPEEILKDGYFSIRGEIIKQSQEDHCVTVKIRQAPRKEGTQPRAFNLDLKGNLEGRAIGYFWDLQVQREGNELVVQDGTMIGMVPPKKRGGKKFGRGDGRRTGGRGGAPGGKGRWQSGGRQRPQGDRSERPSKPKRVSSGPKPQRRSKEESQTNSQSE